MRPHFGYTALRFKTMRRLFYYRRWAKAPSGRNEGEYLNSCYSLKDRCFKQRVSKVYPTFESSRNVDQAG